MRGTELLQTKSYKVLRGLMEDAIDDGNNAIVYGPPSSEKSFVLENLCRQFRAKGRPVIYMYTPPSCTLTHFYRCLADAAEIKVRSTLRWSCRYSLLAALRALPELPAIVVDEAQHLDLDALEGVREIHDMTRREHRRGCGMVMAGSHTLLQGLLHPSRRPRLEQMLSRFGMRVQLEGMSKAEILTLAERAFGNGKAVKLNEAQEKTLLERCSVDDPYYMGRDGKLGRTYYSSRRLLEYIRQHKKNALAMSAEAVA